MPSLTVSLALKNFYPRPPRGGRHDKTPYLVGIMDISIHALREEGDTRACAWR